MKKHNSDRTTLYSPVIHFSNKSIMNNITGNWRYMAPVAADKTSPCEASCPLALPIPYLIREVGEGKFGAAAEIASYETPLPSVCGRVCPHPCEDGCSRRSLDESVAIHALERIAGDHLRKRPPVPAHPPGKSVAVVGGGPAGIAAAYFLLLLGHRVTIFESRKKIGGMLRYGIPGYRLPGKIVDEALAPLLSLKPVIKTGVTLGKNLTLQDLEKYHAVFIGVGAQGSVPLALKGGTGEPLMTGNRLLEGIRTGAVKKSGKNAIIIGGGNSAIDTARSLLRLGSRTVVLYRRELADMPAFPGEVERAIEEGVEIITRAVATEIIYSRGRITGIRCVKVKPGKPGKKRKGSITEIPGTSFTLKADIVVPAIGEALDISAIAGALPADPAGIRIDRYGRTGFPGIFAGGDAVPGPRLVVEALASGKRAAISMDLLFRGYDPDEVFASVTVGGNGQSFLRYLKYRDGTGVTGEKDETPPRINYDYFDVKGREREKITVPSERIKGFREENGGFDADTALREARRCFQCGKCTLCKNCMIFCPDLSVGTAGKSRAVEFNYDYCKGCGICAEECPRGVIGLIKEVHR